MKPLNRGRLKKLSTLLFKRDFSKLAEVSFMQIIVAVIVVARLPGLAGVQPEAFLYRCAPE